MIIDNNRNMNFLLWAFRDTTSFKGEQHVIKVSVY